MTQTSLFDAFDDSTATVQNGSEFKNASNTEHSYHLAKTQEQIEELVAILKKADSFAFDTETSDLDPFKARIVGMSFAVKPHEAWYVPTEKGKEKEIVSMFSEIFHDESKTLIAQNMKFDLKILLRLGQTVKNKVFDTMIAHYLMNADSKHGMDFLSETYLNYKPISITELIGKKGKNQKSMEDLPAEDIVEYASEDADITFQLAEKFKTEIEKPHLKVLYESLEIPLVNVLADMELEGVRLDDTTLKNFSVELGDDLERIRNNVMSLAGEEFNLDSPKQLGPILFEKLKISTKFKKTKTGQYQTSEDVLRNYRADHEIVDEILNYRQLKKLKSTYVDPLPEMISSATGRVHTHYRQTVAATGRLSSDNPNLQNIPIRTEKGRMIRKAFIPKDDDHILLAADYSQVELRIIAALSEDQGMIEAFKAGADIHAATAAKVFGVNIDEVSRDMRARAKAVNFGIIYGQGAFGLAQNLEISRKEAKGIIDSYFEQFQALKDYQQKTIQFARDNGYVETVMGRRRYLKDINAANAVVKNFAERNAINAPIQGSAADIIKKAMIDIHREMKSRDMKSKMVMQVHDELVFDTHKSELEELQIMVVDLMQNAYELEVPLKVDVGTGKNWLEAH